MTAPDLKAIHRAVAEIVFLGDDPRVIEAFIAPLHVLHQSISPGLPPGRGGAVWAVEKLRAAFAKAYLQIEDQMVSGDRCMTRLTAQLRHSGRLAAARPSGRFVTLKALVWSRFEAGKIYETWLETNDFDLLRELGAIALLPSASIEPPADPNDPGSAAAEV